MEKSPRISFFLTMFYGGGGEQVVFDLARGFLARGWQVDFVVLERKGKLTGDVPDGVNVVELGAGRLLGSVRPLARYLRTERPSAMMAISEHAHLVLLAAALLAGGVTKTVIRIGIPFSIQFKRYRSWKDRLIPLIGRLLYPRADLIIANSQGAADDFAETLGVERRRIEVVHNPKDLERITRLAEEATPHHWLLEKDVPVIVGVGRLAEQKGFDVLIRALSGMHEEARLLIVGDGNERERLRELAKDRKVFERVAFVGFAKNPYAYLARADVFALPSRWEGFPNALAEALALGIPSVAADCPYGPRELLSPHGEYQYRMNEGVEQSDYGLLVPVEDAPALSKALDELVGRGEVAERYATLGKVRAQTFELSTIVAQYERLITRSG